MTILTNRPSEFDLIATYFAPLSASEPGAFQLSDDAAIVTPPPGQSLVVTTDALVEGVHFLSSDAPEDIAAKLLRVSLSDLASMGARPASYSLAIAVPAGITSEWFKAFSQNLAEDQQEFAITLIGGDTVSTTGPLTLSLNAMGFVETGNGLRRNGAQIGDDIWVSGTIGDGALGLLVAKAELTDLKSSQSDYLLSRYRRPEPRLKLGLELLDRAHAAIDISDGLIADLGHICETSRVGAEINIADLPLSDAAAAALSREPDLIDLVLGGGDDYELLFTAPSSFEPDVPSLKKRTETSLTKIGSITDTPSIRIFDQNGGEYSPVKKGFTHF